jgi:hypothetical protein
MPVDFAPPPCLFIFYKNVTRIVVYLFAKPSKTEFQSFLSGTECHGRVVNTSVSYSGGPGFKSLPRDRLSWLMFSWFFSVPPRKCRNSILEIRPRPPPSTSSPIHHSLHSFIHSQALIVQDGPLASLFGVSWWDTYRHTVGLLWTSDQPVAEASTYIRTRDSSNQRQQTYALDHTHIMWTESCYHI